MNKIVTALLLATAISLGGCAQLQAITGGISLATKSITNPITKSDEAAVELAIDTGFQILLTYKRACIKGQADVNCKANIALIQPYTRDIIPLKNQLRNFVDKNDQVDAISVYNQLTTLWNNARDIAASHGATLPALPV